MVAQQYLPAAQEGDKRILLLDGEPLGAILRLHAEGVELNNLDQGGSAERRHWITVIIKSVRRCGTISSRMEYGLPESM